MTRLKKGLLSGLIFFLALEIMLRIVGTFKTPNEKASGVYYYRYRNTSPTWVHRWKPNKTTDYKQVEFHYQNKYNEFGVREFVLDSFTSDTSSINILCLGDSFTEGDGAPYDSSWVRAAERAANQSSKHIKFYNAGVCGSDVFFNHQWLSTDVMKIKPKLVVECINTSDLCDVVWMGGKERFNTDSTTSGKVGPRWEMVYRFSHVFRAFVHKVLKYDNNLMRNADLNQSVRVIKQEIVETEQRLNKQGIKYMVVLQLCPHELRDQSKINQYFTKELGSLPFVVDLSSALLTQIKPNQLNRYSWPINGHFNSNGYNVLGKIIYDEALKPELEKLH